mmetsp:Transcript_12388/g.23727  ORF Transcript_12388/g.23727 Transcript_12388/m.23727 type:complete len:88 (-) Transcript_12388:124-387(-)
MSLAWYDVQDLPGFVRQFAANKKADEKWSFSKCRDFEMAHKFVPNEASHSVIYPRGSSHSNGYEARRASSHTLQVVAAPRGHLKSLR